MRGDIDLLGLVLTADEWAAMDPVARAQLLRAATSRDEPWVVAAPPPRSRDDGHYELYEVIAAQVA